ncbi:MAG: carboxypeptidase-like regulatory domain-containing protein [bacterium]
MKKILGERSSIWVLIFVLASVSVWAQTEPYVTISGQVKAAGTGEPLANANVFLANTTLGAATNDTGFYEIQHVPLGTHELFVSLIGYAAQKLVLRVTGPGEAQIDISLKAKPFELPPINVVAPGREWKKRLKRFEKLFWGDVYDASECKILNPEVLDFEVEKKSQIFYATADQPFQIENKTLGYRAQIFLEDFRYEPKTEEIRFYFTPKYEELASADAEEMKKWQENRRKAFLGSFRHFLVALARGRISEEGFELYNLPALPWERKSLSRQHGKRLIVIPDSLLAPADLPNERQFRFKGALEVTYTLGGLRKQTSWITLDKDFAIVNTSGYVNNPYDLIIDGYWALHRVAKTLPRDYQP